MNAYEFKIKRWKGKYDFKTNKKGAPSLHRLLSRSGGKLKNLGDKKKLGGSNCPPTHFRRPKIIQKIIHSSWFHYSLTVRTETENKCNFWPLKVHTINMFAQDSTFSSSARAPAFEMATKPCARRYVSRVFQRFDILYFMSTI